MLLTLLLAFHTTLTASPEIDLFVGTYTSHGSSKGIYRAQLNTQTGALSGLTVAAETLDPSYIALDPTGRFLYAANEVTAGKISAYSIGAGHALTFLNEQSSRGDSPCHLCVPPRGRSVLAANYGSGNVTCLQLNGDGSLGLVDGEYQNTGTGPNKSRQEGPHMHSVYVDPHGRFAYACDLGADDLLVFDFDKAKGEPVLSNPTRIKLPPGSGPRHVAMDPKSRFLYIDDELTNTVSVFGVVGGKVAPEELQNISTLPDGMAGHGTTSAEIECHRNGKWLYVSNRGYDSITSYEVQKDGTLKLVAITQVEVKMPRGFDIDPTGKWLVVGGQTSNDLESLAIDPKTGALTRVGSKIDVPTPVCVLFVKP